MNHQVSLTKRSQKREKLIIKKKTQSKNLLGLKKIKKLGPKIIKKESYKKYKTRRNWTKPW